MCTLEASPANIVSSAAIAVLRLFIVTPKVVDGLKATAFTVLCFIAGSHEEFQLITWYFSSYV